MKSVILALVALIFATAASAQSGYQIRPGDVLGIEVLQDPSLNREVLVLPDGSFSFPFAGNVNASGRSTDQVQSTLAQGISGNFASEPNVFVSVRTLRDAPAATGGGGGGRASIDVYFLGEFNAPGQLSLDRGTTILQALAEAGGLSPFAADRRIQLRRTDRSGRQNVTTIDYRAIANGGVLSRDITLHDGDVILAPERRLFE